MLSSMPTQERRIDRAVRLARRTRVRIGAEIRDARIAAGLSQRSIGAAAGLSHPQVSRIEHGQLRAVSIEQLTRLTVVLGLDLGVRVFPAGQPLRDQAHLDLIGRFMAGLSPDLMVRMEVPVPLEGDLRAWDLQILGLKPAEDVADGPARRAGAEAETRLSDLQALIRRISLKARDSGIETVFLIVSDTRTNRRVVREFGSLIRETFPVAGLTALEALAVGRDPGGWSLILI